MCADALCCQGLLFGHIKQPASHLRVHILGISLAIPEERPATASQMQIHAYVMLCDAPVSGIV